MVDLGSMVGSGKRGRLGECGRCGKCVCKRKVGCSICQKLHLNNSVGVITVGSSLVLGATLWSCDTTNSLNILECSSTYYLPERKNIISISRNFLEDHKHK